MRLNPINRELLSGCDAYLIQHETSGTRRRLGAVIHTELCYVTLVLQWSACGTVGAEWNRFAASLSLHDGTSHKIDWYPDSCNHTMLHIENQNTCISFISLLWMDKNNDMVYLGDLSEYVTATCVQLALTNCQCKPLEHIKLLKTYLVAYNHWSNDWDNP